MKTFQKIALMAGLGAVAYVSLGPNKIGEQNASDTKTTKWEIRIKQNADREEERKRVAEEERLFLFAKRDSLLDTMGYKFVRNGSFDRKEADRLSGMTQMDLMCEMVDTLVAHKTQQYATMITNLLNEYGLNFSQDEHQNASPNAILAGLCARQYGENCGKDIADIKLPREMFDAGFDWGKYNNAMQSKIKDAVLGVLIRMDQDIDKSIPDVIRKFAKYYPALDLSRVSAKYAQYCLKLKPYSWEKYSGTSEMHLNARALNGDLVVGRRVRVYDSRLTMDFFGKNATYKLVKIANNKWQVVRKDKNGNVAKTDVFAHTTDYEMYATAHKGAPTNSSFVVEPGIHKGVAIWANDVLFVQSRQVLDDAYPDPNGIIASRIDSLRLEAFAKDAEYNKMNAIYNRADSLAQIALYRYRQNRK